MSIWEQAQQSERNWHGNCVNSYDEETKQVFYMTSTGLIPTKINGKYPVVDFKNKSVVDIGGGAYSVLLKA